MLINEPYLKEDMQTNEPFRTWPKI